MKKSFLSIILISMITARLFSQQELGTLLIPNLWQANRFNPAVFPDEKLVIGLPGLYNNLRVSNITYNDLFATDVNGETVLRIDNAISRLGDQNEILENLDLETISLGLRLGRLSLSLGHALRFGALLDYPKTLPQLIWQGNAQFIGQEVAFGPDIQLQSYHELGLGAAWQIGEHLSAGGRVKRLGGIASIATGRRDLRLFTSDDVYQLRLDADYRVNSSGSMQYDGFDELSIAFDFGRFSTEGLFAGNGGWAFDLGLQLQLGKWQLSASALDLGGKIRWEEEVTNYTLQGTYAFEGLDVAKDILNDQANLSSALDTLKATYDPVETSVSYETTLPARYYLTAGYQVSERLQLGGLLYLEDSSHGPSDPAFAVSANHQFLGVLHAGIVYAVRHGRFDNIGLNAALRLGPLQILAATDNILTVVNPRNSHSANLRLGLNLYLGRE